MEREYKRVKEHNRRGNQEQDGGKRKRWTNRMDKGNRARVTERRNDRNRGTENKGKSKEKKNIQ